MKSCKERNKTEKNKITFSSIAHAVLGLKDGKKV